MMKRLVRCLRVIFGSHTKKEPCHCGRHDENGKSNCSSNEQDDARIAEIISRLEIVEHRLDDSMNMVGSMDASEFLNRFQMLEDKVDELDSKIKKAQKEN